MKPICIAIVFFGVLFSCNSSDKSKDSTTDLATKEKRSDSTSIKKNNMFIAINSDEALVATALMAAPRGSRDNCKVIGYNMAGEFVTFREGDNEFIVLVDDPRKDGFSAACYHKNLEPFMARGRELKAEGKNSAEIFDIREAEATSGKLDMGKAGSTLHIYYSSNELYDPETFEVKDAQYRYVVYLPFATAESTGLPEKPIASNHPWIMDPGTHKAHIMISPLAEKNDE